MKKLLITIFYCTITSIVFSQSLPSKVTIIADTQNVNRNIKGILWYRTGNDIRHDTVFLINTLQPVIVKYNSTEIAIEYKLIPSSWNFINPLKRIIWNGSESEIIDVYTTSYDGGDISILAWIPFKHTKDEKRKNTH